MSEFSPESLFINLYFDEDVSTLVEYVSCMIRKNTAPFDIGKKVCSTLSYVVIFSCSGICKHGFFFFVRSKQCNEQVDFGAWDVIQTCATGAEGSNLLAEYGDMTQDLNPRVEFIPTVIVDGVRKQLMIHILVAN